MTLFVLSFGGFGGEGCHILIIEEILKGINYLSHNSSCQTLLISKAINSIFFKKSDSKTQTPICKNCIQWLRIYLPMQGTRVQSLLWEDPTQVDFLPTELSGKPTHLFEELPNDFLTWLFHCTFPSAMYEGFNFPTTSSIVSVFLIIAILMCMIICVSLWFLFVCP